MNSAKNMVESIREIVQDLLVPELKAVKVSVEALREETKTSIASLREEAKISIEALRQEIKLSTEGLRQEMRLRDEMLVQSIRSLSDKLDYTGEIRERLAAVEARLPRQ